MHSCLRTTLSAVRGRENIPTHTAVTCLHCCIRLHIESFSQLVPKNKHSLVCRRRWTRLTGLHSQRRKTLKPGAHSKTVPPQPGAVTFRGHCWPFQWVTSCSADWGRHSLYATVQLAWPCASCSSSTHLYTIISMQHAEGCPSGLCLHLICSQSLILFIQFHRAKGGPYLHSDPKWELCSCTWQSADFIAVSLSACLPASIWDKGLIKKSLVGPC